MRERVWINRIRIAVGLFLAVGIFLNDRELTPGWIAFILVLVGLGELASAPGVRGSDDDKDHKGDHKGDTKIPEQESTNGSRSPGLHDPRTRPGGRFKSLRCSV